ncbi:MAG TPA: hypothetical protein VEQ18_01230 [Candidatus Nitrosocosmicus sp.]|nr:hypothetical protein [Candidatus Nitrosocosmicus sp.]
MQRHDDDERQPLARPWSSDSAHDEASEHSDNDDEPSRSFQAAQGCQRLGERVRGIQNWNEGPASKTAIRICIGGSSVLHIRMVEVSLVVQQRVPLMFQGKCPLSLRFSQVFYKKNSKKNCKRN